MNSKNPLLRILKDVRGTTTIEYGLICLTIVIGVIAAISGVADENTGLWAEVSSKSIKAMGGA